MNSIDERYKRALIEEHESYRSAGRGADAEEVARVLKEQYGHDVTESDGGGDKKADPVPERTDVERPPENTAEPKPRRGPRAKPGQGDAK
jgi:hypothetical protein